MFFKFVFVVIIFTQEAISIEKKDSNQKIRSVEIIDDSKADMFVQKENIELKTNIEQHGDFTNSAVAKISTAQPTENRITANIVDELSVKAAESIKKLKVLIEDKIHEATDILEKIRQKIVDDGLYAAELVKRQLKYLIVKTSKAIENIQKISEDTNINILECLDESEIRLQRLFQEYYGNDIKCVEKAVEKVLNLIYDTIEVFTKAYQSIVNLPMELIDCNNTVQCLTGVIVKITQIEDALPDQISQKIQKSLDFLDKFSENLQSCTVKEINNAGIKAAGIVSDVAKCAAEKERDKDNIYNYYAW